MPPRFSLGASCALRRLHPPPSVGSIHKLNQLPLAVLDANRRYPQPVRFISKAPKLAPGGSLQAIWQRLWTSASLKNVDVPSFKNANRDPATGGVRHGYASAETYVDCVKAFFWAVENGSHPASTFLDDSEYLIPAAPTNEHQSLTLPEPEYDAAVIYESACVLGYIPQGSQALQMAMWISASAMGFAPATISTIRTFSKDSTNSATLLRDVEKDFRRTLAKGNDANALATEGERLFKAAKMPQAKAMYERALKVGGDNFAFKWLAHAGLGAMHHAEGRREEALKHLEIAYESQPHHVGLLFAEVVESTDPERARQALYQTGFAGNPEAWARLADHELGLAMDEPQEEKKREHQLWAMEFQRLQERAESVMKALRNPLVDNR